MLRAFKTEIDPTKEQVQVIHRTLGVCRYIYNFYIAHNKEVYEKEKRFVSGMEFSKWLNNEFLQSHPEYCWIREAGSKPVKQAIMNGEKAFRKFFKGESDFPCFKKKNRSDVKAYFPKNNPADWTVERHRIKIPTLGFVRLKEKGYIKANANVKSGTVSKKAGRYYVSVLVETKEQKLMTKPVNEGIGIDLGIKDFATVSNIEKPFPNINNTKAVMDLEKRLKREQRRLSRKYESLKSRNKEEKGEATRQNIQKQVIKVQKIHQKLSNIRKNHLNQVVNAVVKQKPGFITIEDLNVRGMMKNKHLARAVSQQNFYTFRVKLTQKCQVHGIELRIAGRFYPSSKTCSGCGSIKKDLKLSERTYGCESCGMTLDRDRNASINLAHARIYKVAAIAAF
jgi:putative transposase